MMDQKDQKDQDQHQLDLNPTLEMTLRKRSSYGTLYNTNPQRVFDSASSYQTLFPMVWVMCVYTGPRFVQLMLATSFLRYYSFPTPTFFVVCVVCANVLQGTAVF